jgi:uncharacterized repeat protein (TIGR02543 family)
MTPWPNRVEDGKYSFAGVEHQLKVTDVKNNNALHGRLPVGNVTLLLNKSNTIFANSAFDVNNNSSYNGSNIQTVMNSTIYGIMSACAERTDITDRNLSDVGVNGQHLWPLSATEATQFSSDEYRKFPDPASFWWLRTGVDTGCAMVVKQYGSAPSGCTFVYNEFLVRPALYIKLSSSIFLTTLSQFAVNFDLQSGGGTMNAEYIYRDTPTALSNYSGTKSGYTFEGWDDDSSADTVVYNDGETVSNLTAAGSTTTLYAVWKAKPITGVAIDPTTTSVTVGETAYLQANVLPIDFLTPTINWSSSNNSVATVNSTGTVTTSNVGDVTITAKSVADETKYATTTVHIVQQPETAPTLALDYINETVTGFDTDTTGFRIAGTEVGLAGASCNQLTTGTSDIASTITNSSKTLWTKKCATDGNHSDSTTTSIVIPARPVAPTISATAPSLYGLGDGFVGGLTTNEEWNATSATYDGAWTNITGTSVDNLSAGDKVCARTIAEAGVKFKSLGSCVTVGQGVKPAPAPAKPTKPGPVSAKAKKAKGSITFIWGASGFLTTVEIYYRVKGTSKWKIVRVSGASSKKIKLKRKKTYQFQLRSYKTVKGKNYYSAWTKKTVKL